MELEAFQYNLEVNLLSLASDLQKGRYKHGLYHHFEVHDNKRRLVSVATVRDRIVHRLLYDYLVPIWDRQFDYDVWSCRPQKGLLGCVTHTQQHMARYSNGWLWRADVAKFFNNINHLVLLNCLRQKRLDVRALGLLAGVIDSYDSGINSFVGLPIGNLTSQIFANIYLNEFDRFVRTDLKPLGYVRYGDDFIVWCQSAWQAQQVSQLGGQFLAQKLKLAVHATSHVVQPAWRQLHFLGLDFWPRGHRLDARMRQRIPLKLSATNVASYQAFLMQFGGKKASLHLVWQQLEVLQHSVNGGHAR